MLEHVKANPRSRRRKRLAAALFIVLMLGLWTFHRPLFYHNFGVVEHGKVFRSAQPDGNLKSLIRDHRLASVLNLRGGSFSDGFYADEVKITREYGVDFYDDFLSPTPANSPGTARLAGSVRSLPIPVADPLQGRFGSHKRWRAAST